MTATAQEASVTIALAGNPNSGKTSLFNRLTGARAHVGNYPGVTVEKKEGIYKHRDRRIHVVDLPGAYSLTAYSLEELVARDFVLEERPDLVVDVVDAANLERNLYLAVQFMEIGVPVVIALNMIDVAEARGLTMDLEKLRSLLGCEVVPTVARSGKGLDDLMDAVLWTADRGGDLSPRNIRYGPDLDAAIKELVGVLEKSSVDTAKYPARWLAIKILEGDPRIREIIEEDSEAAARISRTVETVTRHLRTTVDDEPEGVIADHRYGFISSVTKQAVSEVRDLRRTISDRVDLVALNRLVGPLLLLAVLYGVYQFTFVLGDAPVVWLETLFGWLSDGVRSVMPEGPLRSLLAAGVIDGVGGVIGFVPLIAFMFFAIAFLEDSGYMARIAFMLDRVLRTFGLHGNSVLALMVGGGISGGCAVPGVMAARTLRDPKERLATILVTPFMNCGAKLPVYAVLIGAFFPAREALMMLTLTLIAWGMALFSARIIRWSVLRGSHTPFVMELPPYRMPTVRGLLIHTWERTWEYLKKAGTIILAFSIIMWVIMSYPQPPEHLTRVFDHQQEAAVARLKNSPAGRLLPGAEDRRAFAAYLADYREARRPESIEPPRGEFRPLARAVVSLETDGGRGGYRDAARAWLEYSSAQSELQAGRGMADLRYSIAGRVGRALEVVMRPLGFDWRTNIALTGGFAAKEIIVSTLGTAYSLEQGESPGAESLSRRLSASPGWNPLAAFTLMIFVMLYAPCAATVVTIGREAGWKWAGFAVVFNTAAAYVAALAVALGGRLLGLGA